MPRRFKQYRGQRSNYRRGGYKTRPSYSRKYGKPRFGKYRKYGKYKRRISFADLLAIRRT